MDATELLKKDHDQVRALFSQYRGGGGITGLVKRVTGNVSERERRSAVEKVCNELDVHAMIEEEIFYPAVKALGDAELTRQVDEGIREHATVKQEVASLRQAGSGEGASDAVDALMTKLEECVEHHASEEEREMFPRVRDLMPEDQRAQLGRQLQARKRNAGGMRPRAAAGRRSARTATARARKSRPSGGRRTMTASAKARQMKATKAKTTKAAKTTGRGSAGRRTVGRVAASSRKSPKGPKRARGGRRR